MRYDVEVEGMQHRVARLAARATELHVSIAGLGVIPAVDDGNQFQLRKAVAEVPVDPLAEIALPDVEHAADRAVEMRGREGPGSRRKIVEVALGVRRHGRMPFAEEGRHV